MTAKIIVQIHEDGQQRNLCLLTDPLSSVEDCLITGEGWRNGRVSVGEVMLVGLGNTELETVTNTEFRAGEHGESVEVDAEAARAVLDDYYARTLI